MRMLSKIVLTAAVLTAAAPALAESATKERFVHEGYTYVYQVKPTKAGTLISGTRYPGATAFQLKVAGDKVSGVSGDTRVAFNVADARGAMASTQK
ncbi:MAG: hypothetical protein QHC67_06285 [Sphingobium sp.]|uniref:hypothetical protein n=1 Tax=Sphingobium sp. TaxID=1912891 RepID=UPI0029AA0A0D|nr:hypothetical protein [Sphingobium sp.]MDX3909413.1 hypothetical protein [Sphingobium sp.]